MAADFMSDTSQFDLARKRAQQQSASNLQGRRDALQRRFAQLGNLDSGARLKIEQLAENEESQNLAQANEGIDAAQNSEMGRRREILQAQEFSRGERLGSQGFGAEQSALQRAWGSGEREAGQKFASGERESGQKFGAEQSAMQRAFMTGEREAGQKYGSGEREASQLFASGERESGQKFAAGESALGRNQQAEQFAAQHATSREFGLKNIELQNMQMAQASEQFKQALEQQKFETQESIVANKNAGGSNWISSTKKAASSWNPF